MPVSHLHHAQDPDRRAEPKEPDNHQTDRPDESRPFHCDPQRHPPQNFRQLSVRQRQRPQTQVTRGVGDAAQAEFNSVDDLVHHDLAEIMLLLKLTANELHND